MASEMFTLGHRGYSVISQVGVSVATVSNSEEDVYYRIDSMKLWEERSADVERKSVGGAWERTIVDEEEKNEIGKFLAFCGWA